MPIDITVQIDRNFEKIFQVGILSKKFRIIRYVWENPGCDIQDARAESGLSARGFQIKLKELIEGGFLALQENTSDGRRKQMTIGFRGREALEYLRSQMFDESPEASKLRVSADERQPI